MPSSCAGLLQRAESPSGSSRSITSSAPTTAPHTANVHAAPCQSPATTIVTNRLRSVAAEPPRLPPSGMNR